MTLNEVKNIRAVRFIAKSFPILLTKKMLENYEVKYRKGYGQVIKKLVQGLDSFNVDGILEDNSQGKVIFDGMSVLDAIRYLAYAKGWCIEFIGKSISFAPCRKPEHTGVTINLKEVDTATIHK